MSQVFPKSANAWSKASIIAIVFVLLGLGLVVLTIQRSDFVTSANRFVEQPVQFSHQHHAGGIGIECRYCHTSVEVSPSAGIPPTKTCINCHSQIWNTSPYLEPVRASFRDDTALNWTRVHDLPDFAYFNHSIHVKKGVSCVSCHGRIDEMPLVYKEKSLTMQWCIDCHRKPESAIRPKEYVYQLDWKPEGKQTQEQIGKELLEKYHILSSFQLTNCSTCHH